eukprot:6204180-Pleurochrysis_carterae.AAC.1
MPKSWPKYTCRWVWQKAVQVAFSRLTKEEGEGSNGRNDQMDPDGTAHRSATRQMRAGRHAGRQGDIQAHTLAGIEREGGRQLEGSE